MNVLNNIKTLYKVLALSVVLVMFVAAVGGIGAYRLQDANHVLEDMYQTDMIPLSLIQESRGIGRRIEAQMLSMMLTTDKNQSDQMIIAIGKSRTELAENLKKINSQLMDEKALEMLKKTQDNLTAGAVARESVMDLIRSNNRGKAYEVYVSQYKPRLDGFNQELIAVGKYMAERTKNEYEAKQEKGQRVIWQMVMLMAAALVIGLGVGFFIARGIAAPVNAATEHLKIMASGDYSMNVPPDYLARKDEFGVMAHAFYSLTNNMRTMIRQVAQSAEQVSAASEELTASAEQSAQASNQIATSISDVATGATEQLSAADEASTVVEQMSAGIQQVAANTNHVAIRSSQAADKAKDGGMAIEKAVNQMSQIEIAVNVSAKVVAKLGDRSKEIGQIVDAISGIAGQTNLLALNAAIEAARAGEQGRGFAVVAEEVRKLAEQSQEAAKKIAELIGEIQGDTDKAVMAMDNGTKEVKTGAEVVNAAGVAFQEIVELVNQVSGQVKEISGAIQQIASGSQQIVGSVKKIDSLGKKSASESQSVSAATEEQLASMEEIASSSQALAKLAQDLQAAIGRFRV